MKCIYAWDVEIIDTLRKVRVLRPTHRRENLSVMALLDCLEAVLKVISDLTLLTS